jgi:serine/threonine protein kinase
MTPATVRNPAKLLEGMRLDDDWTVGSLLPKDPNSTGGTFCQRYMVTNDAGRQGFLKALDFEAAFGRGTDFIQKITILFNFERDLLQECGNRGMDRVVRAIGSGSVYPDPSNPFDLVPYLIFEVADSDIRLHLEKGADSKTMAWKLRALHHVATGLKQLHSIEIAHQDLKPSNVLVFYVQNTLAVSKIADLGNASKAGFPSPYDSARWAGDHSYAPPEILYSYIDPDWSRRRIAADLYMLGGLMSFIFLQTTSIATLLQAMPIPCWPGNWSLSYEEVLPYLLNSFAENAAAFEMQLPEKLRPDLMPVYEMLCNPDPAKRVPRGVSMNKNALEKTLSRLDLLASRAEAGRYDN